MVDVARSLWHGRFPAAGPQSPPEAGNADKPTRLDDVVGQQDGLCYYAMQFIRGQALDEVFQELQRLRSGSFPGANQVGAASAGSLAHALRAGAAWGLSTRPSRSRWAGASP